MKMFFISLLLIFLTACAPPLRDSSQISEGYSNKVPQGLVDWCNTLNEQQFLDEPECMWYCRVYSKNEYSRNEFIKHNNAGIVSCVLH